MRRSRALKRGRWFPLLAAGVVGYVLGDWHAIALRTAELTASQAVALRFPEAKAEFAELGFGPEMPVRATNAIVLGDTSAALLSPAPMIASAIQQAATPQVPAPAPIRVATATDAVPCRRRSHPPGGLLPLRPRPSPKLSLMPGLKRRST